MARAASKPSAPPLNEPADMPSPAGCTQLLVTARVDGFRRAGRAWPATGITVDRAQFDDEQLTALMSEPMLIVHLLNQQPSED